MSVGLAEFWRMAHEPISCEIFRGRCGLRDF